MKEDSELWPEYKAQQSSTKPKSLSQSVLNP